MFSHLSYENSQELPELQSSRTYSLAFWEAKSLRVKDSQILIRVRALSESYLHWLRLKKRTVIP